MQNILQFEPLPEDNRRGSAGLLSIEREVEFSKGKGQSTRWKASGLDEISLTIAPTVYPPREDSILLDLCSPSLDLDMGGGCWKLDVEVVPFQCRVRNEDGM